MKRTTATIAATAAALTIGGGAFGLQLAAADETPEPSPTVDATAEASPDTTTQPAERGERRGGHGHRGGPGLDSSALAEQLGVEEDALTTALDEIRDEHMAQHQDDREAGVRPDRDEMRTQLAEQLSEKLGIDVDTVTAALDAVQEAHQAERQAERRADLEEVLAAAVEDGTLTQADADSVLKAHDAGLLGKGPRR